MSPNDITHLILEDHEHFRREFAELDELRAARSTTTADLNRVWAPLADLLDVHAAAEEEVFYPQLLRKGSDDAEDETLDAIGDHNDIRDGVRDASRRPPGSPEWWEAVNRARAANDEHMGEEEHEGLADFRLNAEPALRESLGRRFRSFKTEHAGTRGLDTSDKDPEAYVAEESTPTTAGPADHSLGIGSLKGR
jgi:hypothetical protein